MWVSAGASTCAKKLVRAQAGKGAQGDRPSWLQLQSRTLLGTDPALFHAWSQLLLSDFSNSVPSRPFLPNSLRVIPSHCVCPAYRPSFTKLHHVTSGWRELLAVSLSLLLV